MMTEITGETTLAELGAILKGERLGLRICQMGSGFVVFVRAMEPAFRESLGYGEDLGAAIEGAYRRFATSASGETPEEGHVTIGGRRIPVAADDTVTVKGGELHMNGEPPP